MGPDLTWSSLKNSPKEWNETKVWTMSWSWPGGSICESGRVFQTGAWMCMEPAQAGESWVSSKTHLGSPFWINNSLTISIQKLCSNVAPFSPISFAVVKQITSFYIVYLSTQIYSYFMWLSFKSNRRKKELKTKNTVMLPFIFIT